VPVVLFNPLPLALAHYQRELSETLGRLGVDSRAVAPSPSTDDGESSLPSRAAGYLRAVRSNAGGEGPTLILWQAFGWLEPALWLGRSEALLIIHDPVPIRRQYGHGRPARLLARAIGQRLGPRLVCHTDEAAQATLERVGGALPAVCLHPILTAEGNGDGPPRAGGAEDPVVLVAGQHKPSRDMTLLAELGPRLRAAGLRPRVVGRGWPEIDGWEVRNAFVSEQELEAEIDGAAVVLVPYRRYWQSNIAMRSLEADTPVVGAPTPFLRSMLGDDYGGFPAAEGGAGSWLQAIEATLQGAPDLAERRRDYQRRVDQSWANLLGRSADGA
jgi:glycosyltransferase involved in cell wall biosynthesis